MNKVKDPTVSISPRTQALSLLESQRGKYIIGQALHIAIKALESVEPPVMREVSNIEDMKALRDHFFPTFSVIEHAIGDMGLDKAKLIEKLDELRGS